LTLPNLQCDAVYLAQMPQQKSPSRISLVAMWLAFVVVTVGGAKLVTRAFGWDSVDYADYSSTTDAVVHNLLVPLLLATLFVVILVSVLKWWRPVIVDDRPVPRWLSIIPIVVIAISLAAADWDRLGDMGGSYFMALAAATLIVGFNEEIMTRGALLVGFRKIGSETHAWAWSTALFSLMHGANLFSGEPLNVVLPQVGTTFLLGTLLYISRRSTGTLLVAVLAHAIWDFSLMSHGTSKAAVVPGAEAALQIVQSATPMVLFVVVMLAHKSWMNSDEPADTPTLVDA
jgi:membrane protease YdiL (CAAX protease family)